MKLALASCSALFAWEVDDRPLHQALRARGVSLEQPVWSDPAVEWGAFDAVLVRTTWDYTEHLEDFLAWTKRVSERTRLLNPPELLRWNAHKGYLEDLAAAGVSVVPTATVLEPVSLAELLERRGWSRAFLKPLVGASASGTRRLEGVADAADQAHLDALVASGGAMVQPYRASVEEHGERSLLFFDGRLSHAVHKVPLPGDYRVQDDHGASDSPAKARLAEVQQAERALAHASERFGEVPLYARADFLEGPHGPELCELEMVEPSLFLRHHLPAAETLADALLARLEHVPAVRRPLPASRWKAVIFDLDGTLADSVSVVVRTFAEARVAHGLPPVDPAATRAGIGLPLRQMLGALCAPGEDADALTATYRALYGPLAAAHESLFEGMLPLLVDLRQGGAELGIATGKSQRGAENAAARHRLGHWVSAVHGIVPGTPGKPHPHVLMRALDELGVAPEEAVFVGDTTFDVAVGRGAGVDVIGVSWGVHRGQDLAGAGAVAVVDDVEALRAMLLDG